MKVIDLHFFCPQKNAHALLEGLPLSTSKAVKLCRLPAFKACYFD
jgi:hypothetical protein